MIRSARLLLAGALLPLTACAPFGDNGAEKAADALAAALASEDVSSVAFTDKKAAKALGPVLDPLAPYSSEVDADDVKVDGDRATASLHWVTDLGPGTWERDTHVRLRKSGDGWLVDGAPSLVESSLKAGERLSIATAGATRGRILGDHSVLVEPRPVLRIGIDKTKVAAGRAEQSARELARVLELDPERLAKATKAAGPKAFVEALVVREADLEPGFALRWHAIPGAVGLADKRPLAPTRSFARQLLGVVGPVNAEVLKKGEGRLAAGDEAGLSGLQLRYDEQLFGRTGRVVTAVGEGNGRRQLFRIEAKPGTDLATTLDARLQQRADDLLQGTSSDSALVAIRPSTGEILALASGPADNGYNTASFGRYPPGSTFKIVSSLALLRSGLSPSDEVSCPATLTVDGKGFNNYSDYPSTKLGTITLADAVANSCNTAFIGSRHLLKDGDLSKAAAALGLGVDHDLGFPAYFGSVPAPESETEAAADLIGQGRVTASPLAMAVVLASVVRGQAVVPHLLADHTDTASPTSPLTAEEARQLRDLLHGVVTDGSGRGLQGLADLAKTGTAEFGDASKTHAWMVGARGDLAVAVFVAEGESGSKTAGPILRNFLESVR